MRAKGPNKRRTRPNPQNAPPDYRKIPYRGGAYALNAGCVYAFKILARSCSGVLIGVRPNFSTSTFTTVLEKNAGTLGPM